MHLYLEVVKYLFSVGCALKSGDNYAIQHASQNGHLNVVIYLVSVATNYRVNSELFTKDSDVSWNEILESFINHFKDSTVLQSTYSTNGVVWTIISKNNV